MKDNRYPQTAAAYRTKAEQPAQHKDCNERKVREILHENTAADPDREVDRQKHYGVHHYGNDGKPIGVCAFESRIQQEASEHTFFADTHEQYDEQLRRVETLTQ